MRIYQEIRQLLPGKTDRDIHDPFDLRHSLGLLIRREQAGRNSEVDQIIEANYAEVCRDLPDHHPHRLVWTSWRGIMLMRQDKLDEADALLTDTYEKRLKILHPENRIVFLGTRTLAGLRVRQNRIDEAIDLLRRGRESGPDKMSLTLGLGALLLWRHQSGDRSEWLEVSSQALGFHESSDSPSIANRLAFLALAVPPRTDAERQMQQGAIQVVRRASGWAEREPPATLLFPELMRPNILLTNAIAEFRGRRIRSQPCSAETSGTAIPFDASGNGVGVPRRDRTDAGRSESRPESDRPREASCRIRIRGRTSMTLASICGTASICSSWHCAKRKVSCQTMPRLRIRKNPMPRDRMCVRRKRLLQKKTSPASDNVPIQVWLSFWNGVKRRDCNRIRPLHANPRKDPVDNQAADQRGNQQDGNHGQQECHGLAASKVDYRHYSEAPNGGEPWG